MKKNMYRKSNRVTWVSQLLKALPIIVFACVVPLIVKSQPVVYNSLKAPWNLNTLSSLDVFNYWKSVFVIFSGGLSAIYLALYATPSKKFWKMNWSFWALLILAIGTVVSTLLSANIKVATWGMIDRHEGAIVWISYIVNIMYIATYAKNSENRIFLMRAMLVSGLGIGTIGALQYFGIDIFKIRFFQQFYLSADQVGKATFAFEANRVYSTLFNPNYVAQYVSMMLPVGLVMIFADKHKIFKGLWVLYSIELVICLIGSEGRGGLLGFSAALVCLLIILLIKKLRRPRLGLAFAGLIIVGGLAGFSLLVTTNVGVVKGDETAALTQLKNVSIAENLVSIEYYKNEINFTLKENTLSIMPELYDESGQKLSMTLQRDGFWTFDNQSFSSIKCGIARLGNGESAFLLVIDNNNWLFQKTNAGVKYINQYGALYDLKPVSHIGFEGNERLGSNRGYIWSRTLPLILKSPLVGSGADNFSLIFPQGEYVLKQQLYGQNYIMVDKPHNMYLQLLVTFGLLGFGALVATVGLAVKELTLKYIENRDKDQWVSLAIVVGIFGFLGSGLFYDTNINVSPVFWTLIGLGTVDVFKGRA